MAGMACVRRSGSARISAEGILRSIDLASAGNTDWFDSDMGFSAVAAHRYDPPVESLHYEDADFSACFCGDLISSNGIPWSELKNSLRNDTFRDFGDYRGIFAFMAEDRKTHRFHLVSDILSIYPLFYRITPDGISVSTSLSTFSILPDPPRFNRDWLFDFFFFNVPIGNTTFLEGVFKMPAASVLTVDMKSGGHRIERYASRLCGESHTVSGRRASELAMDMAERTIPKYFDHRGAFAHGLTSGFDTNTLLSYAPPDLRSRIVTYTYGTPGCRDITKAVELAQKLGFRHVTIPLDERFLENLPDLISESVYLSGGMDNINRASLPYVYRAISKWEMEIPVVISGINSCYAGGSRSISRNVAMISHHLRQSLMEGRPVIDEELFGSMFGRYFPDFQDRIQTAFDHILSEYGDPSSIHTYYSYETYEVLPKYFGGEFSTANNFVSLRMPLLDPDFIRLSCQTRFGSPENIRWKRLRLESRYALHALLIRHSRDFEHLAIHGLPLKAYSCNRTYLFNLYRLAYEGPRKIGSVLHRTATAPPTEDWNRWHREELRGQLDRVINGDTLLARYMEPDFLEGLRESGDNHLSKQVATAEVILRLIDDSWRRPVDLN